MTDAFISYSRDNIDFARRLNKELNSYQHQTWIDLEGIRFTSDWWEEIKRGIENTNNFVLIMSPASLGSPVCHLEIEYARSLNKRVILLNHLPVSRPDASRLMLDRLAKDAYVNTLLGDRNPMLLFDNNWYIIDKYQQIRFAYDSEKTKKFRDGEPETAEEQQAREQEEERFATQFLQLHEALLLDFDHADFHTRLGLRNRDWERNQRNESYLLLGDELKQAETWLQAYDANAQTRSPQPTDEQRRYIALSREAESARIKRLQALRRAGWGFGIAALIAAVFAVGAFLTGLQAADNANLAQTREAISVAEVIEAQRELTAIPPTLTQFNVQVERAVEEANAASTQAAAANTELTAIPPTLTQFNVQIERAVGEANIANTELTAIPQTITPVAATRAAGETQIAAVPPTLTQVAQQVQRGEAQIESLRLASHSERVLNDESDSSNRELAALLAIRALQIGYTEQADNALNKALATLFSIRAYGNANGLPLCCDNITRAQFTQDNNIFFMSVDRSYYNTMTLYDISTDETIDTAALADLGETVFSTDGRYLLTGSNRGSGAELWDVHARTRLTTLRNPRQYGASNVFSVAFSPDNRWAAAGFSGGLIVWDIERNQAILSLENSSVGLLTSLAISRNNRYLLAGNSNDVLLIDISNGTIIDEIGGHTASVTSVAFSPDGNRLLSGGGRLVMVRNRETGRQIHSISFENTVSSVDYSPDGLYFLVTAGAEIYQYRALDARLMRVFSGHTQSVISAQFSPDGSLVLSTGYEGVARLWQAAPEDYFRGFRGHLSGVSSIDVSPDGEHIVTASMTGAPLWLSTSPRMQSVLIVYGQIFNTVAFSPSGQTILTANGDNNAYLWDALTQTRLRTFSGHSDDVNMAVFSSDGSQILTASDDNSACTWVTRNAMRLHCFVSGDYPVTSAIFSPDDGFVLVGTMDNYLHLWDATSQQRMWTTAVGNRSLISGFSSVVSLDFDAAGERILAVTLYGNAYVVDTASGEIIRRFSVPEYPVNLFDVFGVPDTQVGAFTRDGQRVIIGGGDNRIRIWDVKTGELVRILNGHTESINTIHLSDDGKYIYSGADDLNVRIWETDYRDFVEYACTRVQRDFTDSERSLYGIENTPTCAR